MVKDRNRGPYPIFKFTVLISIKIKLKQREKNLGVRILCFTLRILTDKIVSVLELAFVEVFNVLRTFCHHCFRFLPLHSKKSVAWRLFCFYMDGY